MTKVRTTFGMTIDADAAELLDLQRQGLVATKPPKDSPAAPAASDGKADAQAPVEERGGAA